MGQNFQIAITLLEPILMDWQTIKHWNFVLTNSRNVHIHILPGKVWNLACKAYSSLVKNSDYTEKTINRRNWLHIVNKLKSLNRHFSLNVLNIRNWLNSLKSLTRLDGQKRPILWHMYNINKEKSRKRVTLNPLVHVPLWDPGFMKFQQE